MPNPIQRKLDRLIMSDLEIEKRLDRLSNNAVKNLQRKPKDVPILSQISKPIKLNLNAENLNARDLAIEKRLDVISSNSIAESGGESGFINNNRKMFSGVTNEMVEEFNQKEKELGGIIIPASFVPDLEQEIQVEDYTKEIQQAQTEIGKLLKARKQEEDIINDILTQQIPKLDKLYSSYYSVIQARPTKSEPDVKKKQSELEKAQENYLEKREKYDNDIETLKQNIQQIDMNIDRLRVSIDQLRRQRPDEEAENGAIRRRNKERLALMEQEINSLNRGKFSIQQMQDESDDDYLKRMQDAGLKELPGAEIDDIALYHSKVFKNKMREIIRQEDVIETVLKMIKEDHGVQGIRNINETFPLVKTKFREIFGDKPIQISPTNVYNFLQNILGGKQETAEMSKSLDLLTGPTNRKPLVFKSDEYTDEEEDFNSISIPGSASIPPMPISDSEITGIEKGRKAEAKKEAKSLEIATAMSLYSEAIAGLRKEVGKIPGANGPKKMLRGFIAKSNHKEKFTMEEITQGKAKHISTANTVELCDYIILNEIPFEASYYEDKYGDRVIYELEVPTEISESRAEEPSVLQSIVKFFSPSKTPIDPPKMPDNDEDAFLEGNGLKKMSKLKGFGMIHIKPHDLYYNNKLAIRDKKGRSLTGFPDVKGVSDGFVNMVMKVSNNEKILQSDYKNLKMNEKPLFDSLIYQSKLHKVNDIPNGGEQTLKDLKHRLNLLEGEIGAGNTNDDIKKELHQTVYKLVGMGALNHNVAKKYLQDVIGNIVEPRKRKNKSKK